MAALSERLQFILQLDADGAVKGFQRVGAEADRSLGKVDDRLDKLSARMTKFGAASMAASGVAAVGLFHLGGAAAELNAAGAAATQVLGESTAAVEKWADGSVKAVGLSKRAALEAATQFGGIAKAADMSTESVSAFAIEQTQLAADMAAFKNVDPAEAIRDLQAGYAGSTEVLRKYNIYVDDATLKAAYFRETGEKVTGTLTSQQRIVAMHSEIMRQSADMQGQWNREVGEAPAQQAMLNAELENLKAGIGQGVLPAMTSMLGGLNAVVGGVNGLDSGVQKGIGSFATYATAATGVVGALSFVGGQAIKLKDRFTDTSAEGVTSMNNLGKAATIAGGVIAAAGVATALYEIAQASTGLSVEIDKLSKSTDDQLRRAFEDTIIPLGQFNSAVDQMADAGAIGSMERLSDAVNLTAEQQEYLDAAMQRTTKGLQQQRADSDATTAAVDGTGSAARDTAGAQVTLASATELAAKAARSQASALRDALNATYGAGNRAADADDAIADFTSSMTKAGSSSGSAAKSIDLVAEKTKAVESATGNAERALESYESQVRAVRDANDDLLDAQVELEEALLGPSQRDKSEALNDQKTAQLDLADANEALAEKQKSLDNAERAGNPKRIAEAREELERATLAQERATWKLEDATAEYTETAEWSAETDPKVAKARYDLAAAQERVELATRESTKRYQELQDAQGKQTEAQNATLGSFGETAAGAANVRDRVNEAAGAYRGLRDSIFSTVEAILASQTAQASTLAELDALEAKVKAIPGLSAAQRGALLGAIYAGKGTAIGFSPGFAGYASGTPSMPTGDAVVGERGPEIMRRTATGVEVIDAGRSRSMLARQGSGGDVTVNLYGTSVSPHDVGREVAWQIRTS